jgi:hypothetical protein
MEAGPKSQSHEGEKSISENVRKQGRPVGLPKTGGRKAGTSNKKTYWLRDQLEQVDFDWGNEFKNTMIANNYEKAKILIELLPYLNPKIESKPIDEDGSQSDDLNVNINLSNVFT